MLQHTYISAHYFIGRPAECLAKIKFKATKQYHGNKKQTMINIFTEPSNEIRKDVTFLIQFFEESKHVRGPYLYSSRPELFCKKSVLENSAKFTWKHLRQSLFFNKVVSFQLSALAHVFPCEFCEII